MLDLLAGAALFLIGAAVCRFGSQSLHPDLLTDPAALDFWFEADVARVFQVMTVRTGDDALRSHVHPLFAALVFTPVYLLERFLSLQTLEAVRVVTMTAAGLWATALFVLLRLVDCRPFDAMLFVLLGTFSTAGLFFLSVPETYVLGSLTILTSLAAVALSQAPLSAARLVAISSWTLSVTVTNWMVGVLATFLNRPWKQAFQISVNSFAVVAVLWGVQRHVFTYTEFFLRPGAERRFLFNSGWLSCLRGFVFHSMVTPEFRVVEQCNGTSWPCLLTQQSAIGSAGPWGVVAAGLWMVSLGLGLWGMIAWRDKVRLRLLIGLTLLGQFALHLTYGGETILYSLHFLPLLIIVASFGALTAARPLALAVAALLLATIALNNSAQFFRAGDALLSEGMIRNMVSPPPPRPPAEALSGLSPSDPASPGVWFKPHSVDALVSRR